MIINSVRRISLYLIPDLIALDAPAVGPWGMRRLAYLRQHRRPIYSGMLMTGTLNAHLEEIDCAAEEIVLAELIHAEGRR